MIEPSSTLRLRSDVRYRIVDEEAVVIVQGRAEALVLNEVGARILELLDGETPVEGLVRTLHGEFEVDPAELERDVLAFLAELLEAGVTELRS